MLQGSILGPAIFTIIIENSLIINGNIAGLHYTNDSSLLDIKEYKYFCKTNFLSSVFKTSLCWTQTLQKININIILQPIVNSYNPFSKTLMRLCWRGWFNNIPMNLLKYMALTSDDHIESMCPKKTSFLPAILI